MSKQYESFYRRIAIKADAQGNLPSEIQVLHVGNWMTPWHGDFETTADDISQYVQHYEQGIGMVQGSDRLPINYGHDMGGKAAGWFTGVEAREGGTQLWATGIEWTPDAQRALGDGEYKYISPEFNPRALPYEDPEIAGSRTDNVLTGAALTNIPLFKKLKPVMASAVTGSVKPKEGDAMDLKDLRAKKPEDLTDDEKAYLAEHKAELTDDERKTFGLEDAPKEKEESDDESKDDTKSDDQTKQASTQPKGVTITADRLAQLEADAKAGREAQVALQRAEIERGVKAHVAAGRIKSDSANEVTELLLASTPEQRKRWETVLASIPENKLLAGELGGGGSNGASAQDELMTKAAQAVKDSDGKVLLADAMKTIMQTDTKLRDRVNAERAEGSN